VQELCEVEGSSCECEEGNSRTEGSTERSEKSNSNAQRQMTPPSMPSKKFKKRAAHGQAASEIADAIYQLDKIAQNAAEDKPYDHFGKYVAAELRQLPQRQAILLQQEIQNCITRSKLSCLPPTHHPHTGQISTDVMSPGSYSAYPFHEPRT
jgi:hypothetical protein